MGLWNEIEISDPTLFVKPLCLDERATIGAAEAGSAQLHQIVLPAANRADLEGSRRGLVDEASTAGARVEAHLWNLDSRLPPEVF